MSSSGDSSQLVRHLSALRAEISDLREHLEEVSVLEREATLGDVTARLTGAARTVAQLEALPAGDQRSIVLERLAAELSSALEEIGLRRVGERGAVVALDPEQAAIEVDLDREITPGAGLVRVELTAAGWARGALVVVKPTGRVVEIVRCDCAHS